MLFEFVVLIWTLIVLIVALMAIIGRALENLNNETLSCLGTCMVEIAQIIVFGCVLFIFVFLIIVTLIFILFSIFGG